MDCFHIGEAIMCHVSCGSNNQYRDMLHIQNWSITVTSERQLERL